MNTTLKRILCIIIILAVCLILLLSVIKKKSEPDPSKGSEVTIEENKADNDNDIYFAEENEDPEIEIQKKASEDFIGSWTATSARASYQYGNVDINIKADSTWNGNVSDEELKGTWTEIEDGIHLTSNIFDCDLRFTKDDLLVMYYSPNDDGFYLTTVLTAK